MEGDAKPDRFSIGEPEMTEGLALDLHGNRTGEVTEYGHHTVTGMFDHFSPVL
jgi:hypothetical protein